MIALDKEIVECLDEQEECNLEEVCEYLIEEYTDLKDIKEPLLKYISFINSQKSPDLLDSVQLPTVDDPDVKRNIVNWVKSKDKLPGKMKFKKDFQGLTTDQVG